MSRPADDLAPSGKGLEIPYGGNTNAAFMPPGISACAQLTSGNCGDVALVSGVTLKACDKKSGNTIELWIMSDDSRRISEKGAIYVSQRVRTAAPEL